MDGARHDLLEKYLITLRVIQPARAQDILKNLSLIWEIDIDESLKRSVYAIHSQLRKEGKVVSVRKGTYMLDEPGMAVTANLVQRERDLDNARLFLMKSQRKLYH